MIVLSPMHIMNRPVVSTSKVAMQMKFLVKTALVGSLVLGSIPASSNNFDTVQDMIGYCKAADGGNRPFYCVGMTSGVLGMMTLNAKYPDSWRMCPTSSVVSNGQAIQIFLNWAEKNPTKWQTLAFFGFAAALGEAYPCK